jgi:hypothetical protein
MLIFSGLSPPAKKHVAMPRLEAAVPAKVVLSYLLLPLLSQGKMLKQVRLSQLRPGLKIRNLNTVKMNKILWVSGTLEMEKLPPILN